MNRLDKPFRVGDRVVVSWKHHPDLPVGTTGTSDRIPHNNEVTAAWDDGKLGILGCFVLAAIFGLWNGLGK